MKRTLLAAAFGLLGCSVANAETVAISGVRLIDGTGQAPTDNATIVVRDGQIVAAGTDVDIPADARQLDYTGRTVIPGLITNHSHVGQVRGTTTGAANYTRENITSELDQFRRYGVTTVTALGNNGPEFGPLREEAHAGAIVGADLFGVSQGVGTPNGAPPQAMVNVGPDQLYRPSTAEEAREAVRAMAAAGTDLVKIWLDDFGGSLPVKMAPDVYRATIDESHRQNVRVAAHVHDLADAQAVIDAGADIIAHGVRDEPVPPEFVELLRSRGIWYVPTLQLDEATFGWADGAPWTETPAFRPGLSPELVAQVEDPAWRERVLAEPRTAAARDSLAMNLRNLKTLHDAGVRIGFGTDSGATPLRVAGVAEQRELALMVDAGLTPIQALRVATAEAAALMGLDDRGVLEAGRRADFVVLAQDPSDDITAVNDIVEVWERGRPAPGPLN